MKGIRKTYIYKDGEFVIEKPSAAEAAQYAKVSPMIVKNIVTTKQKVTRKGWTFSYEPLSLQELEEIQQICKNREEKQQRKIEERDKEEELDNDEFYIPRSYKERKDIIMSLYLAELKGCRYSKTISSMKYQYMRELLNSL